MQKLKALYWRLFIIRLSFRWIFNYNLGDEVVFKNQVWMLAQGVKSPVWTLSRSEGRVEAHEDQFRKVHTPRNYWRSFTSGYRFYMTSWYSTWMHQGIKPWMRGCRIWGK
ncbi:hypothetical protein [Microbulbifer sp. HZ11]|uniref:hypothetical protein n=1 Tax=Microbulbifer sp. HZ11 TaxID=1453501 RepID=UPI000B0F0098|nr:hypothetical protein [Microbulbifer sp. HZ11]